MTTTIDRPAASKDAAGRAAAARKRRQINNSGWWPLLFIGPFFIGIVVFYLYPIVQTVFYSFTTWGVFGGVTFSGLDNWATLVSDPQILPALLHTVVYILIVLLGIPIGIWLASLLNRPGLRFATFYRTMFFLPYVAMPVAVALVWRIMFNGDFGILNYFLSLVGVKGPHWLATPGLALIAVSVVGLWMSVGFNIIILSSGLKGIPPELYEAAALDGASRGRQFRSVTLPLLTPSIFFVMIINVIAGFQLFDLLFAILGPSSPVIPQTQSLVYLFYNESFVQNNRGYGAAIALVVLLLVGIVTIVQFRLQRRWVNYV
jgi:multiple sugar transport system permease protein